MELQLTGQFVLPEGYSFTDPAADAAPTVLSDTVPDRGYGGADISQEWDANNTHFVVCNAWGPGTPSFRFRAFKEVAQGVYVEVTLPFLSTGRGEQSIRWNDGRSWAIAWINDRFNWGLIPDFVPYPSILELLRRIELLEAGSVPAPGEGGFTLLEFPAIVPEWENRALTGPVLVDVPRVFGVPPSPAYLLRFVVQAPLPDIRVRAGTQAVPFYLTVNTQVPNLQIHTQGWAPGPTVYVSAVNGTPQVWLQVLGFI